MALWKKMTYPSLPKRELGPPNTGPKKFEVFPAPSDKIRKKIFSPHKKCIYLWVGGVYGMENKDTNTD